MKTIHCLVFLMSTITSTIVSADRPKVDVRPDVQSHSVDKTVTGVAAQPPTTSTPPAGSGCGDVALVQVPGAIPDDVRETLEAANSVLMIALAEYGDSGAPIDLDIAQRVRENSIRLAEATVKTCAVAPCQ